jgi:hypothetical protein
MLLFAIAALTAPVRTQAYLLLLSLQRCPVHCTLSSEFQAIKVGACEELHLARKARPFEGLESNRVRSVLLHFEVLVRVWFGQKIECAIKGAAIGLHARTLACQRM